MKTFLFALSLVSSLFFNKLMAAPSIENPAVAAAFESRFASASDAQWTEVKGLYQVCFTLDGLVSRAYFSPDGYLIAVARSLSPTALPEHLHSQLLNGLEGRWITDLFVVETENGKTYYATLQSANGKVVLQSEQGRKWNRYQATVAL